MADKVWKEAKKYLEEHPEEINGIGCSMEQEVKELSVHGRLTIIGAEICITFSYTIKKEPAVIGGDRFWQNGGKPTNRYSVYSITVLFAVLCCFNSSVILAVSFCFNVSR